MQFPKQTTTKQNKHFRWSHRPHSTITTNLFPLLDVPVQNIPSWLQVIFSLILHRIPTNFRRHFTFTVDALLKRSPRLLHSQKSSLCRKMLILLSQIFSYFSAECSDFFIVSVCFWFKTYILKNISNNFNMIKFKSSLTVRQLCIYIYVIHI